jgi:hypothetical protein
MSELAKALCKAQATIDGAKRDSTNPHFKNKYADLASVWEACRDALAANGLSVAQFGVRNEGEWVLVTELLHASGESRRGAIPLLNGKGDMQGLGSALTYARRYGLAAMVGVSPEDDDGNASTAKRSEVKPPTVVTRPDGYDDWRQDFIASADNGYASLKEAWTRTTAENRAYADSAEPELRVKLKAHAEAVDAA